MGNSTWNSNDYATYTRSIAKSSREEIFRNKSIELRFDPKNIVMRESRDSESNPNSTAIILGLDVTGSMGVIAEHIARNGLGILVRGILDEKPVSDPHICVMGIGDIRTDKAPLQVTQFEADIRIAEQLKDIYLEGGGGGNGSESYHLPWYFAANKTSIDCFEKRNKKGYLFTFGDEGVPPEITSNQIGNVLNNNSETNYTASTLYAMASEKYEVFHVIVEQGDYCVRQKIQVTNQWRELIGRRAILLRDYKHISEVVLAVMMVSEGQNPDEVINKYSGDIKESVRHAIYD